MASDLKKVGLVFNADGTTDFLKSLNSVNASLKENYQDFKNVQTQYDKNTSSSQKLLDKQNYLTSAYDLQKNKVTILREELKELENSENRNEVAITKKRTALKAAENQLDKYGIQLKEVSKQVELGTANLKEYSKSIKATGEKLTEAGKKASILSAGIVGIDVAAAKSAMGLETAVNKFLASTGKSVDQTKELEQVLKNIHENGYGEGYSDISEKMSLVWQNLGDISNVDLQNITEQAYLLENVFGMDFSETLRGVKALMVNMDLTAEKAFDYLVVGAQSGLDKTGELADNIAEYSQIWSQADFSAEEMFSILDNGLASGAYNLDKVNDFVKEFTISLSDGRIEENLSSFSSDTRKLFREFQKGKATAKDVFYSVINDLENMENKQKALTLASNVWSALGEDNAMKVITSLNDLNTIYTDVTGAATDATNQMYDGMEAKLSQIKNKFENSFAGLGQRIIESLLPHLEKMADGLQKAIDWFDSLDNGTKDTIVTIGLLVASIGPLLLIMGKLAGSISNIINLFTNETVAMGLNAMKKGVAAAATKSLRLAQAGLNGVMALGKIAISGVSTALSFLAANPIVLVIAAVAALVAGLIYLWNTNENFKNAIISGWTYIQNLFASIDEFITGIFQTDWTNSFGLIGNVLNAFMANCENYYNAIIQIFSGVIDFVKGVFTGDWELALNGIKNIFSGIFNSFLAIAKAPLNGVIGLLNIVIDGLNFLIEGLNKVSFDVPDWVPEIGGKKIGINIKKIGKIPYLANGGTLLNGAAIVAEAGPELLLQQNNQTKVIPLNSNSRNTPYDENLNDEKNAEFNPTININNYSKYVGPADTARQARNEMRKLIWKLKRG
ncbi:phage tail tape measure protein TP901 family [Mycoplasma sp. CAG:877]|nr:phage tail tape measure protein TP901 family [Mycoplasma sp. CAG:877]